MVFSDSHIVPEKGVIGNRLPTGPAIPPNWTRNPSQLDPQSLPTGPAIPPNWTRNPSQLRQKIPIKTATCECPKQYKQLKHSNSSKRARGARAAARVEKF